MLMRSGAAVLAAFGLAGCDGVAEQVSGQISRLGAEIGAGLGGGADATGAGIRTLALLDGAVRVRGGDGYCIDQGASRARDGFAVIAGCALLSQDVSIMPSLDGLITVQVGGADTASVASDTQAFAAFLSSDAGRGLLAGDGDMASVERVTTVVRDNAVLARFEDTSGAVFGGTSGAQWRGFLDVNGRLATVSVLSFARAPLSRGEGERLLLVTLAELVAVNAPDEAADNATE